MGAAFDDNAFFIDQTLRQHLDLMASNIEAASTARVVFVCQAGVNRSSLALCYYCNKHGGGASGQQAKAALINATGAAAAGWPTLENKAFEAFLERCCSTSKPKQAGSTRSAGGEEDTGKKRAKVEKPAYGRWFWRTAATARSSTGGPSTDPAEAAARRTEEEARMREQGIDPKTGRTYGCWANGRVGGRWIRGVPNEKRPWPP